MKKNAQNTKFQTPNTKKGITLIALVITIIVLLILAGVAINMAIDSNGLFGKANEAVEGWNTAVENERVAVQDLLNELGITSGDEEPPVTLPAGWDSNKIASTVTETSTITGTNKERIVPVPKGFVASQITADANGKGAENTIAGGLVIYQGTEPVTGVAGSTEHTTAMETRNQFVWIPVDDINQMVMCKSNASGSVCDLKLVDGTLQCTNTAHTTNATNLCGRLYGTSSTTEDTSTPKTYTTSMNFSDRTQTWSASGYREPDVLGSSYDNDSNTGGLSAFTTNMTQDFINMATSVAKYGGFYVSRYEVGENGASKKNQIVITAGTSVTTPTVYQGVNNWYGLYNTIRSSSAIDKTAVSTHMIYGSQYDQIINFIGSEAQTGHPGNVGTNQCLTGTKDADKLNNIYDLEGNNYEWTAQAYDTHGRVYGGGGCNNARYGHFHPASNRLDGFPTNTASLTSSRTSLYL